MKILFLTLKTFSATGGIEKFNRCFSKALWENSGEYGWQCSVYSAYDQLPDEKYFPKERFRGFGGNRIKFFLATLAAIRRANVVVIGHINLAPLAWLSRNIFRKRTICIAHGREVWEPLTVLQGQALSACSEVWCVSRYTAGLISPAKAVKQEAIRIFPNTLDPYFTAGEHPSLSNGKKEEYGISPGDKILLTVARLANTEAAKGYDIVLEALPAVLAVHPRTKYLLAGKWDEAEKKRIINIINALKLHNVVILTGFIKESELMAHYQLAHCFVLPSRKEGFGIVFLEAAWCGLAVIGGNADGSKEALLQGELGRLVNPADRAELEKTLIAVLSTPLNDHQKQTQRRLIAEQFGFPVFKMRLFQLMERGLPANKVQTTGI